MENRDYSLLELAELDHPSVIMLVGIPGSGKSEIAKQVSGLLSIPVLSSDSYRAKLSPLRAESDQTVSRDAWNLLFKHAKDSIDYNKSIIVDATHTVERFRSRDIRRYRQFGARAVVGLYVVSDVATALHRNAKRTRFVPEHVIFQMHTNLEQATPSTKDGFDFVVTLDNNER